jgi:septal ring factor EnvC (AmiA/AmiB activator)
VLLVSAARAAELGPAPELPGARTVRVEMGEELQQRLGDLEREAASLREQMERTRGERASALQDARRLEQEMLLARGSSERAQVAAELAARASAQSRERADALAGRTTALRGQVAGLIGALYRSGESSPLRRLLLGEDARGEALASVALRRDVSAAFELERTERAARTAEIAARARSEAATAWLSTVAASERAAAEALARRHELVRSLSAEASRSEALLAEREQAADDLMRDLGRRAPAPRAAGPPVVVESPALPGLQPLRGKLAWPIAGRPRVLEPFGVATSARGGRMPRHGVLLDAHGGEPILAVAAGRVAFEEWYKAFGRTLVIDHGAGCVSAYAHAESFSVSPGDDVVAGQRVGIAGDTGSLDGPCLWLQLQCGDEPLDPAQWLAR